jgi:NADP-dependent 3-hydroxy acid dehydrogenase YdfG
MHRAGTVRRHGVLDRALRRRYRNGCRVYQGLRPLTTEDIVDTVEWIASRPAHVNVNVVELMPVAQSFAPFQVHRRLTSIE